MENKQGKIVKMLFVAHFVWFLMSFTAYYWLAESLGPIDYGSPFFFLASSYSFTSIIIFGLILSCFKKEEESRIITETIVLLAGIIQLAGAYAFIVRQSLNLYVYSKIISGIIGVGGALMLFLHQYLKSKKKSGEAGHDAVLLHKTH
jgi:hypothetical protein